MTEAEIAAVWEEYYATPPTIHGLARRLELLATLPPPEDPKKEKPHEKKPPPPPPPGPRLDGDDEESLEFAEALWEAGVGFAGGWHRHDRATGIRLHYLFHRGSVPADGDDADGLLQAPCNGVADPPVPRRRAPVGAPRRDPHEPRR